MARGRGRWRGCRSGDCCIVGGRFRFARLLQKFQGCDKFIVDVYCFIKISHSLRSKDSALDIVGPTILECDIFNKFINKINQIRNEKICVTYQFVPDHCGGLGGRPVSRFEAHEVNAGRQVVELGQLLMCSTYDKLLVLFQIKMG